MTTLHKISKSLSPYGGFWTNLDNAPEIALGKLELGWITEEEYDLLITWIRDGITVISSAISSDVADHLLDDIYSVLRPGGPCQMSFWKDGQKFHTAATLESMIEQEAKLLDLHMVSEVARVAIFSGKIKRFLDLLFERPPLAFQSLAFLRGSEQPIHSDVAFVRVDAPLEFCASWIALEDIQEGSGELEYYAGSQNLPPVVFEQNKDIWAPPSVDGYSERLLANVTENNLKRERFIPRKGDALLWSANVIHGGSKREKDLSRKSLVTHYCPAERDPFYLRDQNLKFPVLDGCFVSGMYNTTINPRLSI